MPFVQDSQNILVGDAGVSAVGNTPRATVNDSSSKVSQTLQFLQAPSLAGLAANAGKDIFPFRNELDQFASYAPIFTLGCLTNIELNFPLTYRTMGPAVKIIKSGGGGGPTIPSLYDLDGKREFFIEDVKIQNTVAPNTNSRHSNATSITFKVIEPYSMGQFFHNLRSASLVTGHPNYLEAPFLLSIAFIGYDGDGNVKSPFFSQRHFPIQLVQVDMDVSGAGATYNVTAVPTSERPNIDQIAKIPTDVQIIGDDVATILQTGAQSLTSQLNKLTANQEGASQTSKGNKYVIMFPNSSMAGALGGVVDAVSSLSGGAGAAISSIGGGLTSLYDTLVGTGQGSNGTKAAEALFANTSIFDIGSMIGNKLKLEAETDINQIGISKINRDGKYAGGSPFQLPSNAENLTGAAGGSIYDRGKTVTVTTPTYNFAAESKITDIIEQVLITSDLGSDLAKSKGDAAGRKTWFRIETQTYNTGTLFGSFGRGDTPKVYVYRVRTYKVDESNLSASPGASLTSFSKNVIKQLMTPKAYNYIYTGVNKDIIDFDLKFNMMFYTGVQASRSQAQMASILSGALGFAKKDPEEVPVTQGSPGPGSNPIQDQNSETADASKGANGGGAAGDTPTTGTARSLNDMIINGSNDMIGVDLKIHGDPFFICDVGIGNYLGLPSSPLLPVTLDGSMNPMDGEVYIMLNFRTPIDYNQDDGYVEYPLGGFLPVSMFSGIYQVIMVENDFSKGKFEQTLKLARKRNADLSLENVASAVISFIKGGGTAAVAMGTLRNKLITSAPNSDEI